MVGLCGVLSPGIIRHVSSFCERAHIFRYTLRIREPNERWGVHGCPPLRPPPPGPLRRALPAAGLFGGLLRGMGEHGEEGLPCPCTNAPPRQGRGPGAVPAHVRGLRPSRGARARVRWLRCIGRRRCAGGHGGQPLPALRHKCGPAARRVAVAVHLSLPRVPVRASQPELHAARVGGREAGPAPLCGRRGPT